VDDPYGRRLAAELPDALTFAVDREATYHAVDLTSGFGGSRFTALTPEGPIVLRTPLPGRFNVANVLGAVAAVRALDVPLEAIAAALPDAGRVPGRFEPVDEGQGFAVLVDYAHTPDSLENVLNAARELTAGRLHCVFGCGGDRDRGKRPLMGAIAARLADRAIVTSDNPRSEEPAAILCEILAGIEPSSAGHVTAEVDRRAAIVEAIAGARDGDVVVIAGKGHEQGQEYAGGDKVPFDDVTVAREALRAARVAR
jgi:UDP-N-acetylmuramoyl-L-alanyl-D-glutamate--2,6-diaminopimelate ligase